MRQKVLFWILGGLFVVLIAVGLHWHYAKQASPTTSSSQALNSCDIAATDFANQQVGTDKFGQLNFQKGSYTQVDTLGNPDWNFTLATSSSLYSFGPDTVRVLSVFADHLNGSGSWYLALGYTCSKGQVKKVLEEASLSPIVAVKTGETGLQLEVREDYQGASAPEGRKTIELRWDSQNRQFR